MTERNVNIHVNIPGLFAVVVAAVILGRLAGYAVEELIDEWRFGGGDCKAVPVIVEPPIERDKLI